MKKTNRYGGRCQSILKSELKYNVERDSNKELTTQREQRRDSENSE